MADENAEKAAAEAAAKQAADEKAAEEAAAIAAAEKPKTVPHEAMHAEREKRKAAEAEVERLKKEAADKAAAEAAEKGEFKSLYEAEKAAREAKEKELAEKDALLKGFEAKAEASIQEMLGRVKNEADRKTVEALIDGKTLEQKETLLPTLLAKFGAPTSVNASPSGSGTEKNQSDAATDKEIEELEKQREEAIQKKDTSKVFQLNAKIRELKKSRSV